MKVAKGTVTAPTSNGATSVVDLSAVFSASEPLRGIIAWTAGMTADGTAANARYSHGMGTRDASAIQQGGYAVFSHGSSLAASDVYHAFNTTFLLKLHSAGSGTVDAEIDLTAMDDDSFTLTFTDAPPSAIVIHYWAFGGADVAKARVGSVQLTAATGAQDVTIAAGWGQPDLLFAMHAYGASLTDGAVPANGTACNFGVAASDTVRSAAVFGDRDAQAAATAAFRNDNRLSILLNNVTAYAETDLGAIAGWPTDGFELNKIVHGATASQMIYMAVQGTFDVAIGSDVSLTAGSTDDIAAGFAPAGALLFGGNLPAAATLNTTHADLGVWQLGGTDGTNEGCAGWSQDDAALDMLAFSYNSSAKVRRSYTPTTPTLTGEADASFNGNNLRLTWSDLDTAAREYRYLIVGPLSTGTDHTASPADTMTIADAISVSVGKSLADTASIADALAADVIKALPDTLGITDSANPERIIPVDLADTAGITDASFRSVGKGLADGIGVTDSLARLSTWVRQFDDALGITDATRSDVGKGLGDTLVIADQLTTLSTVFRQFDDALAIVDLADPDLTEAGALTVEIDDTLLIADSLTSTQQYVRSIADALTIVDARALERGVVLTDSMTMVDATAFTQNRSLLIADELGLTDALGFLRAVFVVVPDGLTVADAIEVVKGQLSPVTLPDVPGGWVNSSGPGSVSGGQVGFLVVSSTTGRVV